MKINKVHLFPKVFSGYPIQSEEQMGFAEIADKKHPSVLSFASIASKRFDLNKVGGEIPLFTENFMSAPLAIHRVFTFKVP